MFGGVLRKRMWKECEWVELGKRDASEWHVFMYVERKSSGWTSNSSFFAQLTTEFC